LLTALSLAGCGGHAAQPKLARADGQLLAADADRIAQLAGHAACLTPALQKLAADTQRIVNAGGVPADLQEPLQSAVNDLTSRPVVCVQVAPPVEHGHGHGKHKGKGD